MMKLYQKNNICYLLLIFILFGCEANNQTSANDVIAVNGQKFYYKMEGSGTAVMVVGSAIEHPRMFSQELRKSFKFIFVDTRLFIPGKIETFTFDDAVNDIEGIRKFLKIDRMVIMGNSMLAIIALEYAKRYPSRVSHLVMIGISPIFHGSYYEERNKYWESHANEERKQIWETNIKELNDRDLKKISPGRVRVLTYVANGPKRCYDAQYDTSWLFEGVTINMSDGLVNFVQSYYKYDITKNIQNVTMPVLLVVGLYDFNNPYYLWNDFKSLFIRLEYHLFEKSGHHPMLEEPARFDNTLIKFIGKRYK